MYSARSEGSVTSHYCRAQGSVTGDHSLTLKVQGRITVTQTEQPVIEEVTRAPVMAALRLRGKVTNGQK